MSSFAAGIDRVIPYVRRCPAGERACFFGPRVARPMASAPAVYLLFIMTAVMLPVVARAQSASTAAPTTRPARFRLQARNSTRVETWRYFEPRPGGGNPDYTFPANRLLIGVDFRSHRVDATAAVQYVQFGMLPAGSTGPGPLGSGPQYFDRGGRNSHQLYLRMLHLRFKDETRGASVQVGRFGYTSGAESASGDAKIEAIKRQRLDSRMIGEFEWSEYQRTFDGVRLDVDRKSWHGTGAWFEPTQGGFEPRAGLRLRHVGVAAGTFSLKPTTTFRHTDVQMFAYRYDDTRAVQARPDNTLLAAPSVDVHINSVGSSVVGAYPVKRGQVDVLGWFVWQGGRWYGQRQAANAAATELGYQWTTARGRPWLRAGWFRSSGDDDPTDDVHGTFFQQIPTARRYSLSTLYNLMNMSERFAQVLLRPRRNVNLRLDVHRLRLTDAADLWYAGSGANARTGTVFGFAGRRSNGSRDLGTMVESAADWTVSTHVTLNGYLGRMRGGEVVSGTFGGTRLLFGYLESVLSF